MKYKIFIFIILFQAFNVFSQQMTQTIRGVVMDEISKTPAPFASVALMNTDPFIGTTTDSAGNFKLSQVPVGRYDMRVSFVGYETTFIRELLVTASKEVFVNIYIREIATTMGEVIVKSKENKQEALNPMATVSARMLSVEEASRYAGGFDDPARLASSFAGVASNVSNNGIIIRGNAPRSLQWKLEGVEIPNPNHFAELNAFGGGGLTALSSHMLANSDFFTGAFPAEYSNALSGVFDIFMRNGNHNKHEHTFQLGAIGIDASSEGPLKKGSKASYLFNYRYSTLSLLTPFLPEEAAGTKYQDLSFKFNFPTSKAGVFSFWGIGLIDRSGTKAERDSTQWEYLQQRDDGVAKQFMGASGVSHQYLLSKTARVNTSFAATLSGLDWENKRLNNQLELMPQNNIQSYNYTYVFASSINKKFSNRHHHKSGIVITGMQYDLLVEDAMFTGNPIQTIVNEKGFSTLASAYTSSAINLNSRLLMNIGLNGQLFTLNNNYTIEPRVGFKYQINSKQSLGFGYGLHSRLEKLNFYFTKVPASHLEYPNKNLDFSKAHHIVLNYDIRISDNKLLRIEPYYQSLFNIPVIPDSSFSFINLQNQWFLNRQLTNQGKGRNYGLDITFEKYLSKGFYYLLTGSIFNSEYLGGDGIWRNTLYNRNYIINALTGKEWNLGKENQNILAVNVRLTYQGGDRYSPVDIESTHLYQRIIYNETQAFSEQTPAFLLAHFTASYKKNKKKSSREVAIKIINATMYSEFFGYKYNLVNKTIDAHRDMIFIPNLSYKIEF
jgi:hypothetical protein